VGYDVLTAATMNNTFWDVTPCKPIKFTDVSEEDTASIFRVED
jgi:hypothetical protein